MTDLSIIIVSYRNSGVIGACLRSIKNSKTKYIYEVLVHDNGSPDDTADIVANEFPWAKLIRGKNIGFAGGNNTAIKQSNGRYILLLNPDTEVEEDTFEVMLDLMERRKDIGMATCKVVMDKGEIDKASRRSFPTPWVSFTKFSGLAALFPKSRVFNRYNLGCLSEDDEYEIDALVGAFQLTRREVVDKIGLLDERFFMYGEDIDWCYRCKQAGWKVYYYPKTKIFHHKGYSSKLSPLTLWEFHRAMVLFYKKHYQSKYPSLVNGLIYLAIYARYLIKARFKVFRPLREMSWPANQGR